MSKNALIQFVEDQIVVKDFPKFKTGDTITVTYRIKEGDKERLQSFRGVVIQICGSTRTRRPSPSARFPTVLVSRGFSRTSLRPSTRLN